MGWHAGMVYGVHEDILANGNPYLKKLTLKKKIIQKGNFLKIESGVSR